MIKALIIDLHGPIIDNFPYQEYLKKIKEMLKKNKISPDMYEEFKKEFGTISAAMEYWRLKDQYIDVLNNLSTFDNTDEEFNNLLKNSKLKLYLATDTSLVNCVNSLTAAGLSPSDFDFIVTQNDCRPKPHTDMYDILMSLNSVKSEEVIVIGDRITDVIPADKLGLKWEIMDKPKFKNWLKNRGWDLYR